MRGVARVGQGSGGGRARAPGGAAGFSLGLAGGGVASAAGRGESAPAGAVAAAGVLAVQAAALAADPAARDACALRQAEGLLEELGALQRALLAPGAAGAAALARLRQALVGLEPAADPGLREAVAAVALRAEIELARHEARGVA